MSLVMVVVKATDALECGRLAPLWEVASLLAVVWSWLRRSERPDRPRNTLRISDRILNVSHAADSHSRKQAC